MSAALLTVAEVAERLRCSPRKVHDLLRSRELRGSKVAGWRVSERDLQTYIDAKANVSRVGS